MIEEPPSGGELIRLPLRPLGLRLWLAWLETPMSIASTDLSPAEFERAARFKFEPDRRRYLNAHVQLRRVLRAEVGWPADVDFVLDVHGKPRLGEGARAGFNMSHSAGWALIGVGDREGIGVDLELQHKIHDMNELAARCFSDAERRELALISGRSERERAFLAGWTRKESCLKALGCGLTVEPAGFHVGLDVRACNVEIPYGGGIARVALESFSPAPGMLAAVAKLLP